MNHPSPLEPGRRAAMVIAHPTHELRVYGWLELTRPVVFILTDGSGRTGGSCIGPSRRLLEWLDARIGSIFGRFTDIEIYAALIERRTVVFIELVDELANAFAKESIDWVMGDAAEGYNPTHDLCRVLMAAAVNMVDRSQHRIRSFDFLLAGRPEQDRHASQNSALRLLLDDTQYVRKLLAARTYSRVLADEIDAELAANEFDSLRSLLELELERSPIFRSKIPVAVRSFNEAVKRGYDAAGRIRLEEFRSESLRPIAGSDRTRGFFNETPFYEEYGERMVAEGRYHHLLRYRNHFLPAAEAIWNHVDRHC